MYTPPAGAIRCVTTPGSSLILSVLTGFISLVPVFGSLSKESRFAETPSGSASGIWKFRERAMTYPAWLKGLRSPGRQTLDGVLRQRKGRRQQREQIGHPRAVASLHFAIPPQWESLARRSRLFRFMWMAKRSKGKRPTTAASRAANRWPSRRQPQANGPSCPELHAPSSYSTVRI